MLKCCRSESFCFGAEEEGCWLAEVDFVEGNALLIRCCGDELNPLLFERCEAGFCVVGGVVIGVVVIDIWSHVVVPALEAEPFDSPLADTFAGFKLIAVFDDVNVLDA